MESILNKKAIKPEIKGKSVIDHSIRMKLKLNCSQYVFYAYMIEQIVEMGRVFNNNHCELHLGFNYKEQLVLVDNLMDKGMLFFNSNKNLVPNKDIWYAAFPDLEKEFEKFWTIEEKNPVTGKIVTKTNWPGSKADAQNKFIKIRKEVSFEHLMKQKEDYEAVLDYQRERGFMRQKMGASVFLNISTKKFDSDFIQELVDLKKMYNDTEGKGHEEIKINKKDLYK